MSTAQFEAGAQLVEDLRARDPGISVEPHRSFAATACPGRNFPIKEMIGLSYELFKQYMERYRAELAALPPSADWPAIDEAVAAGISDGTRPRDFMTREEGMTMVYNAIAT